MKKYLLVLFALFLATVAEADAFGPNSSVCWVPPASSPSPVAGYKIRFGTQSKVYGPPFDVGLKAAVSVAPEVCILFKDIGAVPSAVTAYVMVTAYDARGAESVPSNEVGPLRFDAVAPNAPSGVTVRP